MTICSLRNDNLLSRCVYSGILNRKFPQKKAFRPENSDCAECVTFSLPHIKFNLKGLWHASTHVRHLDFFPAEGFSSLLSGKKISFHRPLSASELCWNLVKRILDHLWAILVVYMCIFLKIHWEIGCWREKVRGEVYEAARDGCCFRLEAGWYPEEERKRQRNSGMRITDGYLWREMFMTAGGKWSVCVCIRQTRPSLNIFCPWRCDEERGKSLQFYPFNIISFLPP